VRIFCVQVAVLLRAVFELPKRNRGVEKMTTSTLAVVDANESLISKFLAALAAHFVRIDSRIAARQSAALPERTWTGAAGN